MLRSPHATTLVVVAALATVSLFTLEAHASPKATLTATVTLDGEVTYDELTLAKGATLLVLAFDGAKQTGVLHIKANQIVVEKGATLSANGAGYFGADDAAGGEVPGSGGGGKRGGVLGHPGGGGGYFGKGASGTGTDCVALPDASGGAAFFTGSMKAALGSAGGAANVKSAATTAGARGGGVVILEAAEIVIDGHVDADGSSSLADVGVAPGAGSGGLIRIITSSLAGTGSLSAGGGSGAHGAGDQALMIMPNNGGGGSGGVIAISTPGAVPASLALAVGGGVTGTCAGDGAGAGKIVTVVPAVACVDVDGDTHTSTRCGGDDCDDSDAYVHPGAVEICNGRDDDCNGKIDDGAVCATGSACTGGRCVAVAAPTADAGAVGDAGAPPDHVEFAGGCALAVAQVRGSRDALLLLALTLAATFSVRRRRQTRR